MAADNARSWPPDTTPYARPAIAEDFVPPRPAGYPPSLPTQRFTVSVVYAVVANTNPDLKKTDLFNDGEISIAVKSERPNEIVMTSFSNSWGTGTGQTGGGANPAGGGASWAPVFASASWPTASVIRHDVD
jgi:hypothetical protein